MTTFIPYSTTGEQPTAPQGARHPGKLVEIKQNSSTVTLVLPYSQQMIVRKMLHSIGIAELSVQDIQVVVAGATNDDGCSSHAAIPTDHRCKIEFSAERKLAEKGARMISTLLRIQCLGKSRITISHLEKVFELTPA